MGISMEFYSIASGSSGNAIYAGTDKSGLLIDVGISGKRIEAGLNLYGHTGRDIAGILITHEHSDHISGLGVMARKYNIPIYATAPTLKKLRRMGSVGAIEPTLWHEIKADEDFVIDDMTIHPFSVSHDALCPVAYRVSSSDKSVAVCTDLGYYDEYIENNLKGLDALLVEANHDIRMLQAGSYPYQLKCRILGDMGHLSNEAGGKLLSSVLHDDIKHVFLGHLSKENNYPDLAYEAVCAEITMSDTPYTGKDFKITVASREEVSELVSL